MPVTAIYGLGNPGKEYENTRHNVGFRVVDALAKKMAASFSQSAFKGEFAKVSIPTGTLWLGKPQTFMNLSGECVQAHQRFYRLNIADAIVVHDDINLPFAQIKLSLGGSSGGHNGVENVILHCGNAFMRVRVGIGQKPVREMPLADYVLGKLTDEEQKIFETKVIEIIECIDQIIKNGFCATQNLINRKSTK
ncbi:MAG: aminoacyl-tRNA hydrolase [Opitutales bacterium]|nr:aminoacyl-tRNA hydrolase [Opitutales bacterium]